MTPDENIECSTEDDRELAELFAVYVDKLNCGAQLDPQEILASHPTLGAQLLEYLEDYVGGEGPLLESHHRVLGDYALRRQIGRGGMGVVYDAWQNSLDRQVALKVLPVGVAADDRTFHRFMREAKTAARLNHENVVRVYGMGVESNTPYYAMEYVDGQTLAQFLAAPDSDANNARQLPAWVEKDGRTNYARLATTFAEVADGLQHAHSKGVVHRDIRPSNLIFDSGGRLRILDFGVARLEGQQRLTLTSDVVGTLLYMSPEQARRRKIPVDHRTDIYSLGVTLYEVLTKRPPFRGKDNHDTLTQIIERDPSPLRRINPAIPRNLETIVLKCLRKSPKDRYESAEAVASDLRHFARGEPIQAQPRSPWSVPSRWVRNNAVRIGVAAMIMSLSTIIVFALLPAQGLTIRQVLTAHDTELNNFWDMRPSPDGRRVAYSRMGSDGALCVRDLQSGEIIVLTPGEFTFSGDDGPVWSSDGTRIAYSVMKPAALRIVNIATKTSSAPMGTQGLNLRPLDWSPDGHDLLCAKKSDGIEGMVSLSLLDGSIRTLVASGWNRDDTARFSPDGRYVAYSATENGNQDIFLITREGSDKQRITDAPGPDWQPIWSPPGDTLIYKAKDGIWRVPIENGRSTGRSRFVKSLDFWRMASWSADAGIFYITVDSVQYCYSLPVNPQDATATGPPRPLLDQPIANTHRCAVSPDGHQIAYLSSSDSQLHVSSPSDRTTRSFPLPSDRPVSNMWWSGDGRSVFLVPHLPGSTRPAKTIYSFDVATGQSGPLFPPMAAVERFHLSPDGTKLLYYRWNGDRGDGRREVIVTERADPVGGHVLASEQDHEVGLFSNWVRPSFSPDGTHVLFATENGNIWLAKTDGTGKRLLAAAVERQYTDDSGTHTTRFVHFAEWHPHGTYVVYDNGKGLFVVNVQTGEQHELPLPSNTIEEVRGVWQWSPDGKQIIFTGGHSESPELWTMNNLLTTQVAGD